MRALLGVLLVVAAGHGLLRLVLAGGAWPFRVVGGLAFSYLSGTAVVGLATTWLAVAGLPFGPAVLVPLLAGLALAGLRWTTRPRPRVPSVAGVVAAAYGGALAVAASDGRVLLNDEYAIWALRGRALALAGGLDRGLFANPAALYQHLDYPLLLPAVIAWSDGVAGHAADGTAHVYAALFAVALLGVVAWGAEALAGRAAAVVAVLLAATTGEFGKNALRLMADVPVAAFALATLLVLLVWLRDGDPRLLRVAVITACGAAATKNEGALFVVAVCVGVAVAARLAGRQVRGPLAVVLLAGAASVPWAVWLRVQGISNDVVNADAGERATDVGDRLDVIARAFVDLWPGAATVAALLVVGVVLAVRRATAHAVAVVVALVLTVGGLALTYVLTPHDLSRHLYTSAYRVLMFPALLVAVAAPVLGTMTPAPERTTDTGGP